MKFHGVKVRHCWVPVDGAVAGAEEEVFIMAILNRAVTGADAVEMGIVSGHLREV